MDFLAWCNKKTESVILNLFQNLDSVFLVFLIFLSFDCQLLCNAICYNEIQAVWQF